MNWLINNLGNLIVSIILLVIIILISLTLINDKKKGKSSCGCNCAHCALAHQCHKHNQNNLVNHKHSPLKYD